MKETKKTMLRLFSAQPLDKGFDAMMKSARALSSKCVLGLGNITWDLRTATCVYTLPNVPNVNLWMSKVTTSKGLFGCGFAPTIIPPLGYELTYCPGYSDTVAFECRTVKLVTKAKQFVCRIPLPEDDGQCLVCALTVKNCICLKELVVEAASQDASTRPEFDAVLGARVVNAILGLRVDDDDNGYLVNADEEAEIVFDSKIAYPDTWLGSIFSSFVEWLTTKVVDGISESYKTVFEKYPILPFILKKTKDIVSWAIKNPTGIGAAAGLLLVAWRWKELYNHALAYYTEQGNDEGEADMKSVFPLKGVIGALGEHPFLYVAGSMLLREKWSSFVVSAKKETGESPLLALINKFVLSSTAFVGLTSALLQGINFAAWATADEPINYFNSLTKDQRPKYTFLLRKEGKAAIEKHAAETEKHGKSRKRQKERGNYNYPVGGKKGKGTQDERNKERFGHQDWKPVVSSGGWGAAVEEQEAPDYSKAFEEWMYENREFYAKHSKGVKKPPSFDEFLKRKKVQKPVPKKVVESKSKPKPKEASLPKSTKTKGQDRTPPKDKEEADAKPQKRRNRRRKRAQRQPLTGKDKEAAEKLLAVFQATKVEKVDEKSTPKDEQNARRKKLKPCFAYAKGKCKKGNDCDFGHFIHDDFPKMATREKHSRIPFTTFETDVIDLYIGDEHFGKGHLKSATIFVTCGHGDFKKVTHAKQKGLPKTSCKLVLEKHYNKLDGHYVFELASAFKYIPVEFGVPEAKQTCFIYSNNDIDASVVNLVEEKGLFCLQYTYDSKRGDCSHGIIDKERKIVIGLNAGVIPAAGKNKQGASRCAWAVPFCPQFLEDLKAF